MYENLEFLSGVYRIRHQEEHYAKTIRNSIKWIHENLPDHTIAVLNVSLLDSRLNHMKGLIPE